MIIALSGCSGIGKGYVRDKILETYPYIRELAWLTTRPPRQSDDRNRIHVEDETFNELSESGELILTQSLYGFRYGIKRQDLFPSKLVRLTEFHPGNIRKALETNPLIVAIGLVTFDDSLLRERLSMRSAGNHSEVEHRIQAASAEVELIIQNRKLFVSVIEVTRESESRVFDEVRSCIEPYLIESEGG